jgi:hypothetical protein
MSCVDGTCDCATRLRSIDARLTEFQSSTNAQFKRLDDMVSLLLSLAGGQVPPPVSTVRRDPFGTPSDGLSAAEANAAFDGGDHPGRAPAGVEQRTAVGSAASDTAGEVQEPRDG